MFLKAHPLSPLLLSSLFATSLLAKRSEEAPATRTYLYVGGHYVNTSAGHIFADQMYVEKLAPIKISQPFPLVFISGQAQTGTVCQLPQFHFILF